MLKDYLRKRLTVKVEYDGNEFVIGRISGMLRAMTTSKKRSNVALDKFDALRYLTVEAYPWEYLKIKKVVEREYPGKCKFYY